MEQQMPKINIRVQKLIEKESDGNVANFVKKIGVGHQRLNRCFHVDPRNGKYPEPAKDILTAILKAFPNTDPNWLLTGNGDMIIGDKVQKVGSISGNNGGVGQVNGGKVNIHNDKGKDEVIKDKDEQVKNMFSILRSELNKFYEKMDKKDVYIERLIAENAAQNSIQNENNLKQMKDFLQAAERKHEGSMRRVEENAKRIDELIKIIIRQDEKTQERADKLVDIIEKKM